MQRGSCKTLRSGKIQANRCRKRRFQFKQQAQLERAGENQPTREEMHFLGSAQPALAALFFCVGRDLFQKVDHLVRLADRNAREIDRH
jgi:hypothetical protein